MSSMPVIKRALISVSDKTGIVEFARGLLELNIDIISTGGTSKLLREAGIPAKDVAEITQFPEIMDGRVKTLHPKVHGGVLGKRDEHADIAKQHDIEWIDLVVVNLYPFAETIKKPTVTRAEAIENIDIGGPAMIRSAAKNMEWVGVVVDPHDYQMVLKELREKNILSLTTRHHLATKAFAHTAQYDGMIHRYLESSEFPEALNLHLEKFSQLRYGENPHQAACAYRSMESETGVLAAKQYQGKQLSYNNIIDADAAIACVREFSQPACVIVKHANPCGVAVGRTIEEAFQQAFQADAPSAYGGIVALNQPCTKMLAEMMSKLFIEVLIAPVFRPEALAVLASKTNLRVLELDHNKYDSVRYELKFIEGGVLMQTSDSCGLQEQDLTTVTQLIPTAEEVKTMRFAWSVVKFIKSNAVLIAKDSVTLGIGAGQVSRVDAVDIALKKAGKIEGNAVLASDAFFPFRDSIDRLAGSGIRAIIQPGDSVRDEEVIAACNEHGIAMVFTGVRCFKH